ncbi:NAD(P)-binding domain-containing protein [Pengzhenrongella sp.]|uniref:NAD(P)-binding domain-containing protein n=1 Tax=Pengzhenrongella sp. TaxID=2888820 RepID=UPI0039C98CA9
MRPDRKGRRHVGFIVWVPKGCRWPSRSPRPASPCVWARRPASLERLGNTPVVVHDTPAELGAACDIVAVCVSTDEDLPGLLPEGGRGLLAGARPGTIVVNHGTGTPLSSRHLAEICAAGGSTDPQMSMKGASNVKLPDSPPTSSEAHRGERPGRYWRTPRRAHRPAQRSDPHPAPQQTPTNEPVDGDQRCPNSNSSQ